jgi:protein-tyrosine phosphatase
MRVLMVCLGNICRSPMAQGIMEARAAAAGLDVTVDSAGTGGWHVGDAPDHRAVEAAAGRGVDIAGQRARQVTPEDFRAFDIICAMDKANLRALQALAPADATARLTGLMEHAADGAPRAVPDPYYGSRQDFETALDLIERGVDGLLDGIASRA